MMTTRRTQRNSTALTSCLASLVLALPLPCLAANSEAGAAAAPAADAPLVAAGRARFGADCGFCHGKDAGGGSTGPDLTHSALVQADKNGELITNMVRSGKPDTGMPAFAALAGNDLAAIVAFIHAQQRLAAADNGNRKNVDAADLAVGDASKGRRYFEANCKTCHTAGGDLAGVAARYQGLTLLRRMLYPGSESRIPKRKPPAVTVTAANGQQYAGALAARDEFTLAMIDSAGVYHSWPVSQIKFSISDPLQAHVDQLARYTDADMHNLLAFLQTLK